MLRNNFKLFNGKRGVIWRVKKDDLPYLFALKDKYSLSLPYETMFDDGKEEYVNVGIDDDSLGGYWANFILHYQISIMKDPSFIEFRSVDELKKYVTKMEQRKPFSILTNEGNYKEYLLSLNDKGLKQEYCIAKTIIEAVDKEYLSIKTFYEKELPYSIKKRIKEGDANKDAVDEYLKELKNKRSELTDFLNIDLFLIKPNVYESLNKSRIISYLCRQYDLFHSETSNYFLLKTIMENTDVIFNVFNYKFRGENVVALSNAPYLCLRKLGYENKVPDSLFGKKNSNDEWDYISVLKRLLFSIKIYDCYPLLSNALIPLAFKNVDEVEKLAKKMVDLGYKDNDDLCNATKHKYPPIAVIIEPYKKIIRAGGGITVMACMCSSRRRKPLYIQDFLDNFDKIIIENDFVFHNLLLLKITNNKQRPKVGLYTLEEAKHIKNDARLKELIDMVEKSGGKK